jgi:glucose/arabinose dehydrogenase
MMEVPRLMSQLQRIRIKYLRIWLLIFPIFIVMIIASRSWEQGSALSVAQWPDLSFQSVTNNLDYPVHITNAGDGSGRLFIVEQPGTIKIYKSTGLISDPFLDIEASVRSVRSGGGGEEGLLSVAFPPGFGTTKDHFYVYYTNKSGDNQVSRFSLSSNPDKADPASEQLILYLDHPRYSNHNGGQLTFGPDGYLYIGTGDGGSGGDPFDNAQDPTSLLGKLLRIDVEMEPDAGFTLTHHLFLPVIIQSNPNSSQKPYRIPNTNPFVGMAGYREEIWALGLRNPWRFSFDRSTGDLFIADVGQSDREEIDFQPASSNGGENYGWNIMEGSLCYGSSTCDMTGLTLPVFDYSHVSGNCSVSGGFRYRGADYPGMQGIYFFADYCSGIIWGTRQTQTGWDTQELPPQAYSISSFGEDEDGELYLLDHQPNSGSVYRIIQTPP